MKFVDYILLSSLTTATAFSQSGWINQPSGVTSELNGVSLIDSCTGTVVGHSDTILRTTDGGCTWTSQSATHPYGIGSLNAVSFFNTNCGMAAGTVFSTAPGVPSWLSTVCSTTDGGLTWRTTVIGAGPINGVSCIDTFTRIFVSDQGSIGRSTDGGASWSAYYPYITYAPLRGIAFAGMNTGTIVGDSGIIIHTTNRGMTWTRQSSGTLKTLRGVALVGANTGTAVGDSGLILHTTDGGNIWRMQQSGTPHNLRGVSMINATTGYVVGDYGTILFTTNEGTSWSIQSSGTTNHLRGVSFINTCTGTVVGDSGTILHTTTGGLSGIMDEPDATPKSPALLRNYPNPFNPETNIQFFLHSKGFVSVKVFDLHGREVATLVSRELSAGYHIQPWNAANMSTGIYFCRFHAGSFTATSRLVLLR